jgi:hypothetical protein
MFRTTLAPLVLLPGALLLGTASEPVAPACRNALEAPPPRVKPLSAAEVEALIRQLGDEDYQTREAATEALKRRPEAALLVLRADRAATDPEVKRRLASIVPVMMSREAAERRLAKLPEYIRNRQIDRVVETMVACRQFVTLKHRDQVLALANDLFAEATRLANKPMSPPRLGWKDQTTTFWLAGRAVYWRHPKISFYYQGATDDGKLILEPFWDVHRFVIRDDDATWDQGTTALVRSAIGTWGGRLVIAAELYETPEGWSGARGGIALGNGDVRFDVDIADTLVITTGDVIGQGRVHGKVHDACVTKVVVLCGGDFRISGFLKDSVVMAGGTITDDHPWNKGNVCRERDKDLIGTWKLYSTTEAGVGLGSAFGLVWVKAVAADSPFGLAGVKPGDVIAAIDGQPVRSARDANRLLCRATVSWGATDLRTRRGDQMRDVIVKLCDW